MVLSVLWWFECCWDFLGGRCTKNFRLIPICYLTSKASGVTELGWGMKVEENWQETGCFKVLLPLSDHLDLVIFQVQKFKPPFLLQLSILMLAFDLFLWVWIPVLVILSQHSCPWVGSCHGLSILIMDRHLPPNPSLLPSCWTSVWIFKYWLSQMVPSFHSPSRKGNVFLT